MMGQQDRLCPLQVGISRHDGSLMLPGPFEQAMEHAPDTMEDGIAGVPDIKFQIQSNLVVPAPRCVKSSANFTDALSENAFNIHVNILKGGVPGV
jgi:hypothetical protein